MSRRSRAREVALQLLFQQDFNPQPRRPLIERFVKDRLSNPDLESFCLHLYDGVLVNRAEIDRRLTQAAKNWRLVRMAAVDRNALRLGGFEILHSSEIAAVSAIDEAIELARRFGSKDSPSFVNGVLDRFRQDAGK